MSKVVSVIVYKEREWWEGREGCPGLFCILGVPICFFPPHPAPLFALEIVIHASKLVTTWNLEALWGVRWLRTCWDGTRQAVSGWWWWTESPRRGSSSLWLAGDEGWGWLPLEPNLPLSRNGEPWVLKLVGPCSNPASLLPSSVTLARYFLPPDLGFLHTPVHTQLLYFCLTGLMWILNSIQVKFPCTAVSLTIKSFFKTNNTQVTYAHCKMIWKYKWSKEKMKNCPLLREWEDNAKVGRKHFQRTYSINTVI